MLREDGPLASCGKVASANDNASDQILTRVGHLNEYRGRNSSGKMAISRYRVCPTLFVVLPIQWPRRPPSVPAPESDPCRSSPVASTGSAQEYPTHDSTDSSSVLSEPVRSDPVAPYKTRLVTVRELYHESFRLQIFLQFSPHVKQIIAGRTDKNCKGVSHLSSPSASWSLDLIIVGVLLRFRTQQQNLFGSFVFLVQRHIPIACPNAPSPAHG